MGTVTRAFTVKNVGVASFTQKWLIYLFIDLVNTGSIPVKAMVVFLSCCEVEL